MREVEARATLVDVNQIARWVRPFFCYFTIFSERMRSYKMSYFSLFLFMFLPFVIEPHIFMNFQDSFDKQVFRRYVNLFNSFCISYSAAVVNCNCQIIHKRCRDCDCCYFTVFVNICLAFYIIYFNATHVSNLFPFM